jgi:hypothetical protein
MTSYNVSVWSSSLFVEVTLFHRNKGQRTKHRSEWKGNEKNKTNVQFLALTSKGASELNRTEQGPELICDLRDLPDEIKFKEHYRIFNEHFV